MLHVFFYHKAIPNLCAGKDVVGRVDTMNYSSTLKVFFSTVNWVKRDNGSIVMSTEIGFDRDWFEERLVNVDTGEFGQCISGGLR
ncbi:hypothetical protein DQQ10_14355 [Pseudochryseolinea flava]|uniref:Uncharacterized protein n=1 Tax=Pseudochryseolinea flava TaxID=2059302 RepID=A0A364Y2N3_9BACT|nr:hypothetical protein DQQ10_14355 [Pseudochryseolinea flava]